MISYLDLQANCVKCIINFVYAAHFRSSTTGTAPATASLPSTSPTCAFRERETAMRVPALVSIMLCGWQFSQESCVANAGPRSMFTGVHVLIVYPICACNHRRLQLHSDRLHEPEGHLRLLLRRHQGLQTHHQAHRLRLQHRRHQLLLRSVPLKLAQCWSCCVVTVDFCSTQPISLLNQSTVLH